MQWIIYVFCLIDLLCPFVRKISFKQHNATESPFLRFLWAETRKSRYLISTDFFPLLCCGQQVKVVNGPDYGLNSKAILSKNWQVWNNLLRGPNYVIYRNVCPKMVVKSDGGVGAELGFRYLNTENLWYIGKVRNKCWINSTFVGKSMHWCR